MSKRKRVTADEKRSRILEYFHEKKEFFTLKELETCIPKDCGIVQQAVKDVLQGLIDDGLVQTDKIGTTVCLWSFPGENISKLEAEIGECGKKILTFETRLERVKSDIQKEEANKEDFEKTKELIKDIEILKVKENELKKQIEKFSDVDPQTIAEIEKKSKFYKDGANTWMDNIFSLKTWCKNKFNIEESEINKQFRIPEDLDYVE